jgi:nucleoside 2-deoxyribosyltransferase
MKSKSILKNSICYLAGPIEKDVGHGKSWRKRIISLLKKAKVNIIFLDPTNKQWSKDKSIDDEVKLSNKLRKEGKWKEMSEYVKKIRRADLRCCDVSDFIIAKVDNKVPTCGTMDEIFTVEDQQKPIFILSDEGLDSIPTWLFSVVKNHEVFSNEKDLVKKLVDINTGKCPVDDRWVFLRDYIKKNMF